MAPAGSLAPARRDRREIAQTAIGFVSPSSARRAEFVRRRGPVRLLTGGVRLIATADRRDSGANPAPPGGRPKLTEHLCKHGILEFGLGSFGAAPGARRGPSFRP